MFQGQTIAKEKLNAIPKLIEPWFMFAVVWSIGATCDSPSRKKFSDFLREKCQQEKVAMQFPQEGLVYDYMLDDGGASHTQTDEDEEEDAKSKKKKVPLIATH